MTVTHTTGSEEETIALGVSIGERLKGGEVIQLLADLGGGKTTLTKGIASGLGINEPITSPSFTVSKEYQGSKLRLHHYDFYRLADIGLMRQELTEVLADGSAVVIIEWPKESKEIFPSQRLITIELSHKAESDEIRSIKIVAAENVSYVVEGL